MKLRMKLNQFPDRSLPWSRRGVLIVLTMLLATCGKPNSKLDETKAKQRQKEIQEAVELSKKLTDGNYFNFNDIQKKLILDPDNVCKLGADFVFMEMGENPDFFQDGSGATFTDRWTNIYYRDFNLDMKKIKLGKGGRNPAWNHSADKPKVVYERFDLNTKQMTGINLGIDVVNVYDTNDLTHISDLPGKNPRYTKNDDKIVFQLDNSYHIIDQRMKVEKISEQEYLELTKADNSDCNWKTTTKYRDKSGVWMISSDDRTHNLLWPSSTVTGIKIVPKSCWLYFSSPDNSGILKLRYQGLTDYGITLGQKDQIQVGDLFDVYDRKASPLTGETIGYDNDRWKGTLRVTKVEDAKCAAEQCTKLYQESIFENDIAVKAVNNSVTGSVVILQK